MQVRYVDDVTTTTLICTTITADTTENWDSYQIPEKNRLIGWSEEGGTFELELARTQQHPIPYKPCAINILPQPPPPPL